MSYPTCSSALLALLLATSTTAPAALGALPRPVQVPGAPQADQEVEAATAVRAGRPVLRYVRVRAGGATVRNIFDVQAVALMDVPAEGLLAVYGERGGWLEVEAPGGFPVWVFGRFLRPTAQPSVFEVTNNNVNLRPSPDTSRASFPLDRRLQAGDLVTAIEPLGPEQVLADSWVRIWTPPGIGAWIQSSRTESLAEGDDGAQLWARAEAALFEVAALNEAAQASAVVEANVDPVGDGRTTVRTAAGTARGRASEALASARALLEAERLQAVADFDAVEVALRGVLDLAPDPATRAATLQELEKVELLRNLARVEAQLKQREQREREALIQRQEERWSEVEASFPLRERFQARGVLESFRSASGATALRLSRAGEVVAELVCESGRYDLAVFLGAELGLRGDEAGAAELHSGVPRVDVTSIEILSAPTR